MTDKCEGMKINGELQRFWSQELEKEFENIKVRHKPPLKCRIKFLLRARGVVEPYEVFYTCRLLLTDCNDKECRFHKGKDAKAKKYKVIRIIR